MIKLISRSRINSSADMNDFVIDAQGVLKEYKGRGGDVVIPDGVTWIDGWLFEGDTNLTTVTIPDSVTHIIDCAFKDCANLTSIIIGNGVIRIGDFAFWGCPLKSVTIPDSVEYVGHCAFNKEVRLHRVR